MINPWKAMLVLPLRPVDPETIVRHLGDQKKEVLTGGMCNFRNEAGCVCGSVFKGGIAEAFRHCKPHLMCHPQARIKWGYFMCYMGFAKDVPKDDKGWIAYISEKENKPISDVEKKMAKVVDFKYDIAPEVLKALHKDVVNAEVSSGFDEYMSSARAVVVAKKRENPPDDVVMKKKQKTLQGCNTITPGETNKKRSVGTVGTDFKERNRECNEWLSVTCKPGSLQSHPPPPGDVLKIDMFAGIDFKINAMLKKVEFANIRELYAFEPLIKALFVDTECPSGVQESYVKINKSQEQDNPLVAYVDKTHDKQIEGVVTVRADEFARTVIMNVFEAIKHSGYDSSKTPIMRLCEEQDDAHNDVGFIKSTLRALGLIKCGVGKELMSSNMSAIDCNAMIEAMRANQEEHESIME